MIRATRFFAAFPLVLLALSGCVSFGGKPPKTLLTLRPDTVVATGTVRIGTEGRTLVVLPISAPAMLSNTRIAVRSGVTDVAYLKDANWADAPARLFADLLAEVIAGRTSITVIDRRQYALAPGGRLSGRLSDFGLDASAGQAVVVYDAAYAPGEGKPLTMRRFAAIVPSGDKPEAVAAALNQAANQVAAQVADWLAR